MGSRHVTLHPKVTPREGKKGLDDGRKQMRVYSNDPSKRWVDGLFERLSLVRPHCAGKLQEADL
jgi:hypothetical protein